MIGLEERDPHTGRWVLYRSDEQHGLDCKKYPYERIPCRVFLDTNVVNMFVKCSDPVFEQQLFGDRPNETRFHDLEALKFVFHVASRADWDLVASSKTMEELRRTQSDELREDLLEYAAGIVVGTGDAAAHARDLARRILGCGFFDALPDRNDRELLAHAIGLGCDAFCTSDRKTIISRRNQLPPLPIRILTPVEWWLHIKPWAGLWC